MDADQTANPKKLGRMSARRRSLLSSDEYSLMLVTGVALWISTTASIIVASFIPEFVAGDASFWRIVLGVPAIVFCATALFVAPRLPDAVVYRVVIGAYLPGILVYLVLLSVTPATVAILTSTMVPMLYGAYHLKTRDVLWSLALTSLIAVSSLWLAPDQATSNIGSWLAVYLPVLWTMTFALHINRRQVRLAARAAEEQVRTDSLTGLADQRGLREFSERVLGGEQPEDRVIGLLMIDLDNFKAANTLHGHLGGDHALQVVARHMRAVIPRQSLLARVGGDEFVLLMSAESRERVDEVGEILRGAVRGANVDIALPDVQIDASIGSAIYPQDGSSLDQLLDAADRRMYAVKEQRHADGAEPALAPAAGATSGIPEWSREPEAIRASPHGAPQIWARSRTQYARMTAGLWAVGGLSATLAMVMPNAITSHPGAARGLVAGSFLLAILTLIGNPAPGRRAHLLGDLIATLGIAALIASTGGFDSPAALLIILLAISQAWFWGTRLIGLRLIANLAVVLSPALYTSSLELSWLSAAGTYGVCVIVLTLTLVLFMNGRVLASIARRAEREASTDALTGTANRRAFNERVELNLRPDEDGQVAPFAIVMLDLDNFKSVNTNEGHKVGDDVLAELARLLASARRSDDMLARVGGDEFAAVLDGVGEEAATKLAHRFVDVVGKSDVARRYGVGASAGFALYPQHGTSLDELMLTADDALMGVKQTGKGTAKAGKVATYQH